MGDVKCPKSPPGTMIQEVRERGDENMGGNIFISFTYYIMDPEQWTPNNGPPMAPPTKGGA